ncbi:hypothetical protein SLA2020_164630 [Shorea laevis]
MIVVIFLFPQQGKSKLSNSNTCSVIYIAITAAISPFHTSIFSLLLSSHQLFDSGNQNITIQRTLWSTFAVVAAEIGIFFFAATLDLRAPPPCASTTCLPYFPRKLFCRLL